MDCFAVSGSKVLEGVGSYVVVAVGTKSFNGRIMMGARVSFIFSVTNNNFISSSDGRGAHSASTEAQHPRRINREDRKYHRHHFVFLIDDQVHHTARYKPDHGVRMPVIMSLVSLTVVQDRRPEGHSLCPSSHHLGHHGCYRLSGR